MVSGVANRHCDYYLDEQHKSRSRASHIGPLCAGASMNEETTNIGKVFGHYAKACCTDIHSRVPHYRYREFR
eukprot:7453687-Heterocapsa_arctica.AAC.1